MAAPMPEPSTRPIDDPDGRDDLVMKQRADDGHQHADGGQLHAAAGFVGSGQPLETEDEQHRSGQVGGLDQILAPIGRGGSRTLRGSLGNCQDGMDQNVLHRLLPFLSLEHLEHPVGDHETADHVDRGCRDRQKAQHRGSTSRWSPPAATSEPTSEMPEMALVADISGVCSRAGTLVMTW